MGGGAQAQVHRERACSTDWQHLALLEHAQECSLRAERQIADLIEEEGAPVRAPNQTRMIIDRTRERPLPVPEQLRLEQRLREGAAVDPDKRPGALRQVMNRARDQLLARTALAQDDH